jgi:hypothetical protein
MKRFFLIILFLIPLALSGQKLVYKPTVYTNVIEVPTGGYLLNGIVIDGDTFPLIKISPIYIMPERKFKNNSERRRYDKLTYNVKIVYPYAILIGQFYAEIENDLKNIPNESDKKKYIKLKEKQLRDKYEADLIDLTYTQGRLLIKLVDRETTHTTFDVIKEFKGDMNAIFWQSLARVFGTSLKQDYDPQEEDQMIEEIIAKIENGQIK